MRFCDEHGALYRGARPFAAVAMVSSFESAAFATVDSAPSFEAVEQLLIENHLPYAICYADRLEALTDFRVAILADQLCLSDAQCESLIDYVRRGGRLIVTGRTADYDERFLRRRANGLQAVRDHPHVRWIERLELIEDESVPRTAWIGRRTVHPPGRSDALLAAIDAAWPVSQRPVHVAPAAGTASNLTRLADGTFVLHLMHYEESADAPPLRVTWPAAAPVDPPSVCSPWPVRAQVGRKAVELTDWQVYAAVRWKPAGAAAIGG
jgi:hypothetical protein